jgi:hypothetical protein
MELFSRNSLRSVFIQDALYETSLEAYSGGASSKQRDSAILLLHRSLAKFANIDEQNSSAKISEQCKNIWAIFALTSCQEH